MQTKEGKKTQERKIAFKNEGAAKSERTIERWIDISKGKKNAKRKKRKEKRI